MTKGRLFLHVLALVVVFHLPSTDSLSTNNNKNNKDAVLGTHTVTGEVVKLVCDIDEATKYARISLPTTKSPPPPPRPPPVTFSSKSKKQRKTYKSQLVLEYEAKVEQMHQIKRAQPTISSDDLKVVFVDDHLVVANKPSGVLCVPDINQNPSLLDLVYKAYGDDDPSSDDDSSPSSMIVNRLDMDTSGLVVFGRTPDVTKRLNEIFRDRHVEKEYQALLCGHLPLHIDAGSMDLPLQRDPEHPPFMRVTTPDSEELSTQLMEDLRQAGYKKQGRKKTKPSQTEFIIVGRTYYLNCTEDDEQQQLPVTRIRLLPQTGRTHQLRVHCAALGFPIIGDPTYGIYGDAATLGGLNEALRPWAPASLDLQEAIANRHPSNVEPMCLHAARLCFAHPITGEQMEWNAPVPF
jgi:tRNA pseudouridine32 synthase/23S rRNA pseudouridine746 synthase